MSMMPVSMHYAAHNLSAEKQPSLLEQAMPLLATATAAGVGAYMYRRHQYNNMGFVKSLQNIFNRHPAKSSTLGVAGLLGVAALTYAGRDKVQAGLGKIWGQ